MSYSSSRAGSLNLFWKPADGSGTEEQLLTSQSLQIPASWSPDGHVLAYTEYNPITGWDIGTLAMEGERKPQPFLRTPFNESQARFSPDGRWLAYVSNESGRDEVYVQPFPGPGGKWLISTEGGNEPVWNPSGRELFYRNGDKMMVVAVTTTPAFSAAKPRLLFEGQYETNPMPVPAYDVTPDGQRFVMIKGEREAAPTQLNVVLNWSDELRRLAPAGKR